ncbi:MAG TPA: hypothetical protein VG963_27630 [Polyangiaceae bacterium]|nr:hypothetical protein [Polyangiaceae bacterium]
MKNQLAIVLAVACTAGVCTRVSAQSTSADASAQSNYIPSKPVERIGDTPQGWSYGVTLAANLNVASNRDVVGQLNGNSVLFGASAIGAGTYLHGPHEWLNTGTINEAWSRTPAIDRFVKSNDLVDLQSLYNFFLTSWTGPFARLALQTGLLKTDRVTATPITYVRSDNPAETQTTAALHLSKSFQPFTLNESAGWFFQPLRSEPANVSTRVGFGGRHTFADGARAVTAGANDMGPIIYSVLSDVHQAGAELFAGIDGKLDARVIYNISASALFPFINNDHTDRSIVELTRVVLTAALGLPVFSWLSVNYQLKVMRDPQLVDAVQVQNALLFSLQYKRAVPATSEKKECDCNCPPPALPAVCPPTEPPLSVPAEPAPATPAAPVEPAPPTLAPPTLAPPTVPAPAP